MKKSVILLLALSLLLLPCHAVEKAEEDTFSLPCKAALLMERESGTVLYAKNENAQLSPASVTKVMTMLLLCEAIDGGVLSLDDTVTASRAAASMGGSQIWLEEGEQMSVGEMLKCVAVVSANDCAVALAEKLCGSEGVFTARMNERAAELGLEHTHFSNCTGLSSAGEHYTSAHDIAVMARELLSHSFIRQYTTLWTDTIRGGQFGLTNTNKLVRYYEGCTGLKTGFTNEAMFCLAASAERDGTEYIAVILHGDSSADRFDAARTLLDYAFASFVRVPLLPEEPIAPVGVERGVAESVAAVPLASPLVLVERTRASSLRRTVELNASLAAPVEAGQTVGRACLWDGEELLAEQELIAANDVPRRTLLYDVRSFFRSIFSFSA